MTSETDRTATRRDYSYDNEGRLTGQKWYAIGGSLAQTFTYTYDKSGNQTSAQNAQGVYSLTYDELDRVKQVVNPFGLALSFAYDQAGNRTKVEEGRWASDRFQTNDVLISTSYDAANRLERRQLFDGAEPQLVIQQSYTDGNRLSMIQRHLNSGETDRTNYSYDGAGHVTLISHGDLASTWSQVTSYTYVAGQLTAQEHNSTVTSYSYDELQQLTQDGADSMTYDAAGSRKEFCALDRYCPTANRFRLLGEDGNGSRGHFISKTGDVHA
ncbi:MAG: hypothetical protein ACJ8C4_06250 [Gemmataceae bacterium]